MTDTHESIALHDFCFMRQGQLLADLTPQDAHLLQPIILKKASSGCALLLIHGFGSSPAVYREMMHQVTEYDALFCPLLPGHGRSLQDFSEAKAADWLSFIEKTFDGIAKDYKKIDVLGLSLGGVLACHLAKTRTIHRLYLLAPALALNHMPRSWIVRLFRCIGLRTIPNRGGSLLHPHHGELTFRKLPLASISEIFRLIEQFEFVTFAYETIVFLGKYDRVIHNQKVQAIVSRLPNVSMVLLEHSAHVLPLDNDLQHIVSQIHSTGNIIR